MGCLAWHGVMAYERLERSPEVGSKVKHIVNIEFPVLVYRDRKDGRAWVAQSLMTCTTAVSSTPQGAAEELCGLLQAEVEEAFRLSKGDVAKALATISFPAPQEAFIAYYTRGVVMQCESPKARPKPRLLRDGAAPLPPVTFAPRQAAAYA